MSEDQPRGHEQWTLRLLGGWRLLHGGEPVVVASRQQRIIAALALLGPMPRRVLAGVLWPECREARAAGSLRAGVWHLRHELPGVLSESVHTLSLTATIWCDVTHARERMTRRLIADRDEGPMDVARMRRDLALCADATLLPGWFDDWLIDQQEDQRRLRLGALEALALQFIEQGHILDGVTAATMAVAMEPLRESARRLVILGHLRAGNHHDALREYRDFRALLARDVGASPSLLIERLVVPARFRSAAVLGQAMR